MAIARTRTDRAIMTVVQALSLTLGLEARRVTVLDALRRKRNVADYTGDEIADSSVASCIEQAERLLKDLLAWRTANRPKLITKKR
jgi:hypothetical protein